MCIRDSYYPKICQAYQTLIEKQLYLQNYQSETDYLIFSDNKRRNIPYEMEEIEQYFYMFCKNTTLCQLKKIANEQKLLELQEVNSRTQESHDFMTESSLDFQPNEFHNNEFDVDLGPIPLFVRQQSELPSLDIPLQSNRYSSVYERSSVQFSEQLESLQHFSRTTSQIEQRDFGEMPPVFTFDHEEDNKPLNFLDRDNSCLLYTSPSPRDRQKSRMPSSA
eukprot:TRINITY_DN21332_c0_g1_i2.p1 TRINITY_DN21332_c0_g1~~TRINITY_DN21332_c0_g1_i2.p1  ORF type:complete len:221 (+),score=29.78 TRINITY_DN21332_c0_g1_i2:63-725(+)